MKRVLYFIAIVLIASCKKEDVSTNPSLGFLESWLNNNPRIYITKTIDSNIHFERGVATYRGYTFKPLYDVKITAIGGKIAETGTFKIVISDIEDFYFLNPIYVDSVVVSNIQKFQYKTVKQEIVLSANKLYIIAYLNKSHSSVYDALYMDYVPNAINNIVLPLLINDISINMTYYSYGLIDNGVYRVLSGGGVMGHAEMRGLVDFKYELKK